MRTYTEAMRAHNSSRCVGTVATTMTKRNLVWLECMGKCECPCPRMSQDKPAPPCGLGEKVELK